MKERVFSVSTDKTCDLSHSLVDCTQTMSSRIVLEQLNRDLSANRAKVEGWAQSKITAVDSLQNQHSASVKDLKSELTLFLLRLTPWVGRCTK